MKAIMFEGGEMIGPDNDHEVSAWTEEGVLAAFIAYFGVEWAEEETDMYEGGDVLMSDTIHIINDRLAQAVTDSCDGGMTYLVLC